MWRKFASIFFTGVPPQVRRSSPSEDNSHGQFVNRRLVGEGGGHDNEQSHTRCGKEEGVEPDVVMACAGDVPTLETLAAVDLLRQKFPELKIRVVNVVDLMTLQSAGEHSHSLSDKDFDSLFTTDKPVIFAFHGYPWLIHRLTYRRTNHRNIHVRGYKEEGTTTTPFDMVVLNDLDRFHLVMDVIERVPKLEVIGAHAKQEMRDKLMEHHHYVRQYGDDLPEIRDWQWPY